MKELRHHLFAETDPPAVSYEIAQVECMFQTIRRVQSLLLVRCFIPPVCRAALTFTKCDATINHPSQLCNCISSYLAQTMMGGMGEARTILCLAGISRGTLQSMTVTVCIDKNSKEK